MRKFFLGILVSLMVFLLYRQCLPAESDAEIRSQSALIRDQISNVGKLIVSEGNYNEVFTFEDSKEVFGAYLTAEKKALIMVKTKVTIAYDLHDITYSIDSINKVLRLTRIPPEEISVYPELEYYDVQSDFFNPFNAEDYNRIKDKIKQEVLQKVNESALKSNAQNRLISELAKFHILTESLGWTLMYRAQQINTVKDFDSLIL